QMSTGCEIRFVTNADAVLIALSSLEIDGEVLVYQGDYFHSQHILRAGSVETLLLQRSERFDWIEEERLRSGRFSPDVWRIMISRSYGAGQGFCAVFHYVDAFGHDVRPPRKDEMPTVSWLAYGSSITHGSGALSHHSAYIQQAAMRLGVDVLNKGLGGACLCEPEVADWLPGCADWSFATLEIGVNMRERFTPLEFEERARYLITQMVRVHPDKPVVLITIYPNHATYNRDRTHPARLAVEQFNEILRSLHAEFDYPGLHLIEGHDIADEWEGLTTDLIHPSDRGHCMMGLKLAAKLEEIVPHDIRFGERKE
ncbi:GDSL-type esterase/lipase family protein, partial [Paenibacillus sp. J5C_2022]|uniref:GDSL-type esterase/lipase family protein n=1 Tax=Paenibacillus sp. J5C2022 TaxID=2977129 RepID=UPI0021CE8C3C